MTTECLGAGWPRGTMMPHGWLGVRLLHEKAGRVWHTIGKRTGYYSHAGLRAWGRFVHLVKLVLPQEVLGPIFAI